MSAEDIRTSSEIEDEAIQDAIGTDDDDIRYSLRSRSVLKKQGASVKTSTGLGGTTTAEARVSASTGARAAEETAGRPAELFFLPRSGRCCALLSPAAALLGQLMRG